MTQDYKIVVIGVSAGGLNALSEIIPSLPGDFPVMIEARVGLQTGPAE